MATTETGSTTIGERSSCVNQLDLLADGCESTNLATYDQGIPSDEPQARYGETASPFQSGNFLGKEPTECRQGCDEDLINRPEPLELNMVPCESRSHGAALQTSALAWKTECSQLHHSGEESFPSDSLIEVLTTTDTSRLDLGEPNWVLNAPRASALVQKHGVEINSETLSVGASRVTRAFGLPKLVCDDASSATALGHAWTSLPPSPTDHSLRGMNNYTTRRTRSLPSLEPILDEPRHKGVNEAALVPPEATGSDRTKHSTITSTAPVSSLSLSADLATTAEAGLSTNTSPLSSPQSSPLGNPPDLKLPVGDDGIRQSVLGDALFHDGNKERHHANVGTSNAPLNGFGIENSFLRRSSRLQRHIEVIGSTFVHSSWSSQRSQEAKPRQVLGHGVSAKQGSNGRRREHSIDNEISGNWQSSGPASYLITPQSHAKCTGTQLLLSTCCVLFNSQPAVYKLPP
ncbi:MAG: hypothetical protein M1835_005959 [Candelina submexicana]|nr:MAG: hypothetical protein M1835_005959 [Candelina submexicana]